MPNVSEQCICSIKALNYYELHNEYQDSLSDRLAGRMHGVFETPS
jgi:hypothetical protein